MMADVWECRHLNHLLTNRRVHSRASVTKQIFGQIIGLTNLKNDLFHVGFDHVGAREHGLEIWDTRGQDHTMTGNGTIFDFYDYIA